MHFYLFSEELQAWFSSLLEMKFLISEKYESSFSSKSAWLSGSEFGEEIFVPNFERIPECWLTATWETDRYRDCYSLGLQYIQYNFTHKYITDFIALRLFRLILSYRRLVKITEHPLTNVWRICLPGIFSCSCFFKWRSRLVCWPKQRLHRWHLKGFSLLWMLRTCRWRLDEMLKERSQYLHLQRGQGEGGGQRQGKGGETEH